MDQEDILSVIWFQHILLTAALFSLVLHLPFPHAFIGHKVTDVWAETHCALKQKQKQKT